MHCLLSNTMRRLVHGLRCDETSHSRRWARRVLAAARVCAWACSVMWAALPAVYAQGGAEPPRSVSWLARVSHVVDGDSLWVRPEGGGARVRLRLQGIDAPEICQPYGRKAREALHALAYDRLLHVTVHARDRWGRAIAEATVVGETQGLSARMVSGGWAWSEGHGWRKGAYWHEQQQARQAGRGLFAGRAPEHPADFRQRHGPCRAQRR